MFIVDGCVEIQPMLLVGKAIGPSAGRFRSKRRQKGPEGYAVVVSIGSK